VRRLGRVEIRKIAQDTNYATDESVLECLHSVAAREGLPIFDALSKISQGEVDGISLAKDSPYRYFYASTHANGVSIILKDEERTIEMQLTMPALKQICA
jgi:hypothetical protein